MQSFGWAKMAVNYSQTMPLDEALRLTFSPENLCGVCEFVADGKTRSPAKGNAAPAPSDLAAKGKLILAPAPEYIFIHGSVPTPKWPREHFRPVAHARPSPPTEPPRAV